MRFLGLASSWIGTALLLLLIWRAARGKFIARFPIFYSYIFYWLSWQTAFLTASQFSSPLHWTIFWRFSLVNLVAEFGVLVEISDHIFNPFPAIRKLGRVLTIVVCAVFSISIFPSLFRSASPTVALLGLGETTSIAKAAIICLLLATARYYRLPLGRKISGMMLGFSVYVGVSVANFALAGRLGRALYAATFSWVGALSSVLCLLIWAVALWRYEPVVPVAPAGRVDEHSTLESLTYQLERFNTTLESLLRK
jgi:hypothetical protein